MSCCSSNRTMIIIAIAAVAFIAILQTSLFSSLNSSYLPWLILLLCPLMHIFMMKEHSNEDSKGHSHYKSNKKNSGGGCH